MDLKSKQVLMVAVAVVLFVLAWGLRALGPVTVLLQASAIALIVWVLFADSAKSGGLFLFAAKGFVVSLVLTTILWFVGMIPVLGYLFSYGFAFSVFINVFAYSVLPSSLLPVALSVTAYGVSRKRLPAWLILLSSWYVSVYGVFAAYDVWWLVFIFSYLTRPPYFGGGGLIALEMLLVFLAFIVACIFTAIYAVLRRPRGSPPP